MTTLEEQVSSVASRDDLVRLVSRLAKDYELHGSDWPNGQLGAFLEALAAWISDMDGYFVNIKGTVPEPPSWQLIGQMLLAARIYE